MLGYAIVGAGDIASWHAENVMKLPDARLVSIVDMVEDKARQLQARVPCLRSYTTWKECLADKAVDAVIVTTPGKTHGMLTIEAARAGKHVLCEKPLDIESSMMDEMIRVSRKEGIKLGSIFQRRTTDTARQVKALLDSGRLGKPVLASAYLKYYRDAFYYKQAPWRGKRKDGGGTLLNMAVHGIDLLQWLGGGVRNVQAKSGTFFCDIEDEDTSVILVEFMNGSFGVIEASTAVFPEQSTRLEFNLTEGSLSFDDSGIRFCESRTEGDIRSDLPEAEPLPVAEVTSVGHYRLLHDFHQAIVEDRDPAISGEEARKAIDIIHAVFKASISGQTELVVFR